MNIMYIYWKQCNIFFLVSKKSEFLWSEPSYNYLSKLIEIISSRRIPVANIALPNNIYSF